VSPKKIPFRIAVKLLASPLLVFTLAFLLVSVILLIYQIIPWIGKEIVDIDPVPLIFIAFAVALAAVAVRNYIMRKFSRIRP
jgi:putative flippase GtrA